jgi:hypothetical protein
MAVDVRETTIEEIEERLIEMQTDLNKINYLESALKGTGFSFEIKRFIWGKLAELFEERNMLGRAARARANKAGMEITFREKIDSYLDAGELFARAGHVDDADEMFIRASRDSNAGQKGKIKLARKNIFLTNAQLLEKKGKKASASKFYEKLIKMGLDDLEKEEIKHKLIETYTSLGLFREAKLLEGI